MYLFQMLSNVNFKNFENSLILYHVFSVLICSTKLMEKYTNFLIYANIQLCNQRRETC